jgi:High-affinity nickel-transport protein
MQSVTKRICLVLLFLLGGVAIAAAGSSLGIGSNEVALQPHGLFGGFFGWINSQQKEFYRSMTGALKAMRDDGSKAWLLVGLSFAYGIFHAAGPGHGKAVISSAGHLAFVRFCFPASRFSARHCRVGVSGFARHDGFNG